MAGMFSRFFNDTLKPNAQAFGRELMNAPQDLRNLFADRGYQQKLMQGRPPMSQEQMRDKVMGLGMDLNPIGGMVGSVKKFAPRFESLNDAKAAGVMANVSDAAQAKGISAEAASRWQDWMNKGKILVKMNKDGTMSQLNSPADVDAMGNIFQRNPDGSWQIYRGFDEIPRHAQEGLLNRFRGKLDQVWNDFDSRRAMGKGAVNVEESPMSIEEFMKYIDSTKQL